MKLPTAAIKAQRRVLVSHVYDRRASGCDDGGRGHYYRAALWADIAAARRFWERHFDSPATLACGWHTPSPQRIRVGSDESEKVIIPRKLGELHFVSGMWTDLIVAHELMHAMINIQRTWPEISNAAFRHDAMAPEELLCYRFGRMYSTVYRWLWAVDAYGEHRP